MTSCVLRRGVPDGDGDGGASSRLSLARRGGGFGGWIAWNGAPAIGGEGRRGERAGDGRGRGSWKEGEGDAGDMVAAAGDGAEERRADAEAKDGLGLAARG